MKKTLRYLIISITVANIFALSLGLEGNFNNNTATTMEQNHKEDILDMASLANLGQKSSPEVSIEITHNNLNELEVIYSRMSCRHISRYLSHPRKLTTRYTEIKI